MVLNGNGSQWQWCPMVMVLNELFHAISDTLRGMRPQCSCGFLSFSIFSRRFTGTLQLETPVGFSNRLEWKYLFCLPISPKDLLSMKFSQSPKVFASLDWSASEREAVLRFFLGSERVLRFSSCSKVSKLLPSFRRWGERQKAAYNLWLLTISDCNDTCCCDINYGHCTEKWKD